MLHLLSKGYSVYTPTIDTGLDFVVEPPALGQNKFIGIQVKTSYYQSLSDWWMWSIYRDDYRQNHPFFYVLFFEDIDKLPMQFQQKSENGILCFIIPYAKLDKLLTKRSAAWAKKGEFGLSINRQSFENGRSGWLNDLSPYLNNWKLLS
jgi:hypothetical protein